MPLPFKVESLDKIPEAQRSLYVKGDEGFVLDVEGVESKDTTALENALERLKREKRELKTKLEAGGLSAEDAEELERLRADKATAEEAKAREAGKFDELKAKLEEKHAKALAPLQAAVEARDKVIKRLTVTNELRAAIAAAGIKDEYRPAVEALLLQQNPDVQWEDGKDPVGVFTDDVDGAIPISKFVTDWAKSDAASPYMPPENGGGGGATGDRAKGRGKSYEGKKFSDMTPDEQVAFTNEKYGSGAAA